jgi:hypothetical protein
MIFRNPAGAPELACDACGCRWFDRMTDSCYECGEPVSVEAKAAFAQAIAEWRARFDSHSANGGPGAAGTH